MLKYVGKRLIQGLLLLVVFLALLYLAAGGTARRYLPAADLPTRSSHRKPKPCSGSDSVWISHCWAAPSPMSSTSSRVTSGLSFTQYPNTVGSSDPRAPAPDGDACFSPPRSSPITWVSASARSWRGSGARSFETALTLGGVAGYTVFYPWFAILMLWLFGFALELVPARQVHRCAANGPGRP